MQVFRILVDRKHLLACLLLFAAAAIAFAPIARGQAVAVAEVDGYVTDPSGQFVVNAQVKMIDVDTSQVRTAFSDATGRYAFPNLPVGNYRLEATASGFKTYLQNGITVEVAHNVELNFTLQVGSVTESVQVTGNAAMVETKENSIAQVVDQQRIVDLPLNGRDPHQLLTLSIGGTTTTPTGSDLTGSKNMGGSNPSSTFSVGGSQTNGINFLLDGGDNNDAFSNVNLPIPFPDAIQEFSVQANGLSAQYGLHPGGVANIVTKSGSNAFHGDLFDFFRNGDLNARQEGTLTRDTLKRNQFGGTAGGRIIKDKLFFFGGFQGTRQRSDPATQQAYVPTSAALSGDFSYLDAAKPNGCLAKAVQLKSPSGTPYPNNQIPTSSFDPAAVKLLTSYIPTSANPCGLEFFGYLANNPDNQWIGRVDYVLSDKHTIYVRSFIYDFLGESLFNGSNALTTGTAGNMERSQTYTIGDSYSFSGTKLNSFHATFDRRRDDRGDATNLFSPKDLGVNMYDAIPNYTQLTVSGYSGGGFNIGCGTCAPGDFNVNTFQLSDDFVLIKGKHQFGFGVDGRRDEFNSVNNQQDNGQFTFNGTTSGDGLADLLLGRFSGLTDGNALSDYLRQTVFAAYALDTFHVTPHLTLNYGIRWEPGEPAYDKYGRGNQFQWGLFDSGFHSTVYPTAPAGLVFTGDTSVNPNGKALTNSHWALFSPRLGVVWDPKGDGKQVFRLGGSIMHETTELFYPERWTTNPPYASSLTLTSGQFSNPFATYVNPTTGAVGDPFPGSALFPVAGTYVDIPPNLHPTYTMQWNAGYQRQLGKDWLVEANYLGSATRHIWGSTDINYSVYTGPSASTSNTAQRRLTYLANPTQGQFYGDIQQTDDGVNSEYNGLLLKVQHRLANHFTILANYTWSHCISEFDFSGELAGTIYQNPTNRDAERGSCSFDHRQIFNSSIVMNSGGFGGPMAHVITAGWQLSPIFSMASGQPLTITDGGKDISLSGQDQDRPNIVGQVIPSNQTLTDWFNPAAFAVQPAGTFGNAGRDIVYGPGTINFDMAISRVFALSERYKLEARGDFFNILNHGNWNNPGVSIASSGTFGVITAFSTPRIIQMALKFYF